MDFGCQDTKIFTYLFILKGFHRSDKKKTHGPQSRSTEKGFKFAPELVLQNSKCGLYCKNSNIRKSDTYKTFM